jgi:hypothetical protein
MNRFSLNNEYRSRPPWSAQLQAALNEVLPGVKVESWYDGASHCEFFRASRIDADDRIYAYVVRVTDHDARHGSDAYLRAFNRIVEVFRRLAELGQNAEKIDPVAFAYEEIDFLPGEIADARLRAVGTKAILEVDLKDSSWEPEYEFTASEIAHYARRAAMVRRLVGP